MSRWRILDGPNELSPDKHFTDGGVWGATLENVNDPAQRRLIQVVLARSILQSAREGLERDVREAVESNGRTAIERFLDEQEPPDRILVSSGGIHAETE
jgi:hypothetical protein